ncbi:MAG TPA: hypothetical protein VK694_01725 [Verrucomicrobiae bacterium]|nr:hypothetical protein [Verrucomicrobiae bacterium]
MFGHNNDNNQQQDQTYSPDPSQAVAPATITELQQDAATAAPAQEPNIGLPTVAPSDPTASATVDSSSAPAVAPASPAAAPAAAPDDLLGLKQEALHQLSPLVGHLDQTPEEKFRTTMMMIQATDDHTKIKDAYEAAQAITDDKVRAQALLDVVNEINYFTQQDQKES